MIRLPKVIKRSKKRVGRGVGSGKGSHTSGRGQKGQKSRGKVGVLFEGMKMKKSLLKRLPLMRGKGKFHPKKNRKERERYQTKSVAKKSEKASEKVVKASK